MNIRILILKDIHIQMSFIMHGCVKVNMIITTIIFKLQGHLGSYIHLHEFIWIIQVCAERSTRHCVSFALSFSSHPGDWALDPPYIQCYRCGGFSCWCCNDNCFLTPPSSKWIDVNFLRWIWMVVKLVSRTFCVSWSCLARLSIFLINHTYVSAAAMTAFLGSSFFCLLLSTWLYVISWRLWVLRLSSFVALSQLVPTMELLGANCVAIALRTSSILSIAFWIPVSLGFMKLCTYETCVNMQWCLKILLHGHFLNCTYARGGHGPLDQRSARRPKAQPSSALPVSTKALLHLKKLQSSK